jgi:uncharacterized protein YndB with AHSA1/START domain
VGTVTATTLIAAPLAEVWDFYFRPDGWPSWVDQFGRVEASDGYPERGGTLRWRSGTAGRGTVEERVLGHEPRSLHRIAFSDPESEGELEVAFAIEPGIDPPSTRVTQTMSYRIKRGRLFRGLTDVLFVRSQVRRSLERSLSRLRAEVESLDSASPSG